MLNEEVMEQARFIFETSKLIRDRAAQVLASYGASKENQGGCSDLSMNQMHVMLVIKRQGELTVSELADILKVSVPSASAMVDRLVEKGVLTREHSVEDRRKVVISLSNEAQKDIGQVEQTMLQFFTDLVEKMGPETARKWFEVLQEVRQILENESRSNPATTAK